MSRRYPDWDIEGRDWPGRDASSFVECDGLRWHVQQMGPDDPAAPVCVLIHGTGAATHSWRDLMPILARNYRVMAMDLPGHGFTRPNPAIRETLPNMARVITNLLEKLNAKPDLVVGHSAGAAIGAQMALEGGNQVHLAGITPALMPFPGLAAKLFPQLAALMFTNPFTARIFARMARYPNEVERFLKRATGSTIEREGYDYYTRLLAHAGHCDGALKMMANWDLDTLASQLPALKSPTLLIGAGRDKAIPLASVRDAAKLIPDCNLVELPDLGHLAHEERPDDIAALIRQFHKGEIAKGTSDGA